MLLKYPHQHTQCTVQRKTLVGGNFGGKFGEFAKVLLRQISFKTTKGSWALIVWPTLQKGQPGYRVLPISLLQGISVPSIAAFHISLYMLYPRTTVLIEAIGLLEGLPLTSTQ